MLGVYLSISHSHIHTHCSAVVFLSPFTPAHFIQLYQSYRMTHVVIFQLVIFPSSSFSNHSKSHLYLFEFRMRGIFFYVTIINKLYKNPIRKIKKIDSSKIQMILTAPFGVLTVFVSLALLVFNFLLTHLQVKCCNIGSSQSAKYYT